jgi:small multidrug resistance pump
MVWVLLLGAIAAEVLATSFLKLSEGFTRLVPSIVVVAGYAAAFVLLSQALKQQLQVSIAYAIWSGVGTAAIAVIGVLFLKEPVSFAKIAGIVLVVAGVVVLNLAGAH